MLLKAHSPRECFGRLQIALRLGKCMTNTPQRHMPDKPPVACRKIKRQGMHRQTLRKWYAITSLNRIAERIFGSGFFLAYRRYISIVTFIILGLLF